MTPPDSPALADAAASRAAAYVHIPFCSQRCPYCDFAVVEGVNRSDSYFEAVLTEIDLQPDWRPLDAVFFGGGTPSLAGAAPLRAVLDALRRRFGLGDDCEVSLEANPEDWTPQMAADLVRAGFSRVSFGAQSWDAAVLDNLGRRHRPHDSTEAVLNAQRAGFDSVSVDLIFGEPAENAASWVRTIEAAVASGVDHISTYALTVEPGTELFRSVRDGGPAPDDDVQADRYETAVELLSTAGFVRYEVSNHARPGHHCLYNLIVWARGEYLGFGMSAHGFRDGRRTRNARVLREYLDRVAETGSGVVGTEQLAAGEAELERLFVGLRRAAGVEIDEATQRFIDGTEAQRLLAARVIGIDGDRLRVLNPLLTDTVARALLG